MKRPETKLTPNAQKHVRHAADFAAKAEALVVDKGECPTGDRNTPLMGYWSLAFELHKAILSLLENEFYGAAFALVRPIVEATVRAHLVICADEATLQKLLKDEYRTNFGTVGNEIDAAFGTDGLFERFLTDAKDALHGYTHMGAHQLGRRFSGYELVPSYEEGEVIEVIKTSTSAVFMVNGIVTKLFGWEQQWEANKALLVEWGR